ncbi:DUF7310 family coiled-coil domain-containing protein [Natronolimnohabitans innermongolicus]|uniref:DUF7310 domain-containing protein n=1 Tax=Natronolimnohabitans innermongolicus JCM 12255 TaxID=1227499 RepID=L9X4R3_9EURY|nr:hypothetical protein [Natronolimnohabitans innermongolicus]ELY56695.1 hypothetical protein C493_09985 [Natronolimnohabitans innermongolicus JCM 12255]
MSDIDRIEHRLAAVERAVIDGDYEVDELAELATLTETVERLEERIDEQERRLATLEAQTESVAGVVTNVESVNETVERQAASAVATVDRLEERIDDLEGALEAVRRETAERDERVAPRPKRLRAGAEGAAEPARDRRRSPDVASAEGDRSARRDEPGTAGSAEATGATNAAESPEAAVASVVGSDDGSGSGDDGSFEWCADESTASGAATPDSATEPGAGALAAAEQGSVERALGERRESEGTKTASATESTDGEANTTEAATESDDGLLATVRAKLS